MAERSKAPDSRLKYLPITQWEWAFWSPNGGVGSNPTPDNIFFLLFLPDVAQDRKRVANISELEAIFQNAKAGDIPGDFIRRSPRSAKIARCVRCSDSDFRRSPRSAYKIADI